MSQTNLELPTTVASSEICCHLIEASEKERVGAAGLAIKINPANAPSQDALDTLSKPPTPDDLALLTRFRWNAHGQHLTVGFLDTTDTALIARILSHMNAWGSYCNFQFSQSATPASGQVRITRARGGGYSSRLGTNILSVRSPAPTMSLEGFSMDTKDSEFYRVVRHETGHTMGFHHEHLRQEIVGRIDPEKAYPYFLEHDLWRKETVDFNVLTPLNPRDIIANAADPTSIMCYQLPGEIMKDGIAVRGGLNLDAADQAFAAKLYPLPSWNLLDNRDALEITAANGHLYQRRSDGSVDTLTGFGRWTNIDSDANVAQIAAGGDSIYKRSMDGQVLRFDGPTRGAPNGRWVTLKADTTASNIVASADAVYQLTDSGEVYIHASPNGDWDLVDSSPHSSPPTVEIAVAGQRFYLRHGDGRVFKRNIDGGLESIKPPGRDTQGPVQIVAAGDQLYLLYESGKIWGLDASKVNLGASSFKQIDSDNPDTVSIAASGNYLYQLRKNREICVYTGYEGFPWYRLQGPADIAQIVPDGDRIYQLRSDGSIYVLNGLPLAGWHPELPAGINL